MSSPRGPFALSSRVAALLIGAWTLAFLLVSLLLHRTPLYFVETDLLGEYLPAAREWLSGYVDLGHYSYKGPGYPWLLALMAWPFGGDVLLAARIASPLAAGLSAWLAFQLARDRVSDTVATYVLLAFLCAPVTARYAIEAGTDMPALALMLAATWLAFAGRGPAAAAGAGLCTALAILMRTNAAFLVPCIVVFLAFGPVRLRRIFVFGLATALPLVLWAAFARAHGGLPADRNYLNVAWELYGHGQAWERFEPGAGARFHSMLDVLAFDPLRALARIARNLLLHRRDDWLELTTPWLGSLAPVGLVLLLMQRRARAWLAFGLVAALTLALVFYNARFGLYVLPIELAAHGAGLAFLYARIPQGSKVLVPALALAAIAVAAGLSVTGNASRLEDAPHETRIAGERLALLGLGGGTIYARKPHVGWFAGMKVAPVPLDVPLEGLARRAVADDVSYLFYSGLEQVQRPEWAVLEDSGTALPGIEQVIAGRLGGRHFYAVYRLASAAGDSAAFDRSYGEALSRFEARHREEPSAILLVAVQELQRGHPREALARLDALERRGARDPTVSKMRGIALERLGDLDGAAEAFRQWIELGEPGAENWNRLGRVYGRQDRLADAIDAFTRGLAYEPTNLELLGLLGQAQVFAGRPIDAAHTFERMVVLSPKDATSRRYLIGAWQAAGDAARATAAYGAARAAGFTDAQLAGDPAGRP